MKYLMASLMLVSTAIFGVNNSLLNIEDSTSFDDRPCQSVNECLPLIKKSDYARVTLGILYIEGRGVNKKVKEGLQLILNAAENKFALAQAILGFLYYDDSYGIKKDLKKSTKWFLTSAIDGFALSQYQIGNMYLTGYGVSQNEDLAVIWIKEASSRGELGAMRALGGLYIQGRGVKKNKKRGEAWIQRAANICKQNQGQVRGCQ